MHTYACKVLLDRPNLALVLGAVLLGTIAAGVELVRLTLRLMKTSPLGVDPLTCPATYRGSGAYCVLWYRIILDVVT